MFVFISTFMFMFISIFRFCFLLFDFTYTNIIQIYRYHYVIFWTVYYNSLSLSLTRFDMFKPQPGQSLKPTTWAPHSAGNASRMAGDTLSMKFASAYPSLPTAPRHMSCQACSTAEWNMMDRVWGPFAGFYIITLAFVAQAWQTFMLHRHEGTPFSTSAPQIQTATELPQLPLSPVQYYPSPAIARAMMWKGAVEQRRPRACILCSNHPLLK